MILVAGLPGGGVSVYISTSSCSRRSFFCLKPSLCFLSKTGPYVGVVNRATQISVSSWMARDLPTSGTHAQIGATEKGKFGMIAGARNVVIFNTKCAW